MNEPQMGQRVLGGGENVTENEQVRELKKEVTELKLTVDFLIGYLSAKDKRFIRLLRMGQRQKA